MTEPVKQAVSLKAMAEAKLEGIQKATYFKLDPNRVEFEPGFNLREDGPELDAYLESLLKRTQGRALSPLEQGRGFLRLIRYGLTVVQIVERVGLHRNTVDNWLILAEAPSELQQMVSRGEVAAFVAVEAVRKHGAKAAELLKGKVEKVKATGETKVTRKHVSGPRMPAKVQHQFISATTSIFQEVDVERLVTLADDKTVPVKAATLRALLAAHGQCVIAEDGEL